MFLVESSPNQTKPRAKHESQNQPQSSPPPRAAQPQSAFPPAPADGWLKWLSGVALLGLLAQTASAQNGTWTNIASGNWSAAINWQSGIVATGVDNTATV